MNTHHIRNLIVFALLTFFLAGCSGTSVTGSWKNSEYTGQPFSSIMVIGLTKNPTNRLFWEDIMASRLNSGGLQTVVKSLAASQDDKQVNKDELIDYVNKNGIEAVLVTRLVDTKTEKIYRPPSNGYYVGHAAHYNNFNTYYNRAYNRMYSPGYTTTQTIVLLETNLYMVKDQKLIWNMTSDTVESGSVQKLMESVSKKVVSTLKKDQLI